MFMRLIYLKNSTFLSLKITVDTLIDVGNETSKHHVLKSVKLNKLTLLSVGNVPVRFRTQRRTKYNSLSLTANCIAAKRCLRHYFKLIWESPTTKDTNFHRQQCNLHSKLESNGLQVDHNHKFPGCICSTPAIFNATSKLFGSQSSFDDKNWLDLFSIFFKICRFRSSILLSL